MKRQGGLSELDDYGGVRGPRRPGRAALARHRASLVLARPGRASPPGVGRASLAVEGGEPRRHQAGSPSPGSGEACPRPASAGDPRPASGGPRSIFGGAALD
ncbi:hypothetical protein NL676_020543 [Syzygium grande]|nr:hypothetical protein NL676_020543 [Syzygium grande]